MKKKIFVVLALASLMVASAVAGQGKLPQSSPVVTPAVEPELGLEAQLEDFVQATWKFLVAYLESGAMAPEEAGEGREMAGETAAIASTPSDQALAAFERLLAGGPGQSVDKQAVDEDGLNSQGFNPEISDPLGITFILDDTLDRPENPCLVVIFTETKVDGTIKLWAPLRVKGIGQESSAALGAKDAFTIEHAQRFLDWAAAHDYPCSVFDGGGGQVAQQNGGPGVVSIHCWRPNLNQQVCVATFADGSIYIVAWCREGGKWKRCATEGSVQAT